MQPHLNKSSALRNAKWQTLLWELATVMLPLLLLGLSEGLHSRTSTGAGPGYKDPGVRTGTDDAGGSLPGLTPNEEKFFQAGKDEFVESEGVGDGLGPRLRHFYHLRHERPPHLQALDRPVMNKLLPVSVHGVALLGDGPLNEALLTHFIERPDNALNVIVIIVWHHLSSFKNYKPE